MAIYYSADHHFAHKKIITHCGRPFSTFEEMDEIMISNIAATVRPNDDFYIIGDFAFSRARKPYIQSLFNRIPGRKHLVVGNHDHNWVRKYGWASISDIATVKDNGTEFILCHYPMITWNKSRYGTKHLFGHVHNEWFGSDRAINVGVDCWDFKPVQRDAILARMETLGAHPVCGNNQETSDAD